MKVFIATLLLLCSTLAYAATGNMHIQAEEFTHSGSIVPNATTVYYRANCAKTTTETGIIGSDYGTPTIQLSMSMHCYMQATTDSLETVGQYTWNDGTYINYIKLETKWQSVGGTLSSFDHKTFTSLIPVNFDGTEYYEAETDHYMECVMDDADVWVEMTATPMWLGATGIFYEAGAPETMKIYDPVPEICQPGHVPGEDLDRVVPFPEWEWFPNSDDCSSPEFTYSTAGEFNSHMANFGVSFRMEHDDETECEVEDEVQVIQYKGYQQMMCFGGFTTYFDWGGVVLSGSISYRYNGGMCKLVGMEP